MLQALQRDCQQTPVLPPWDMRLTLLSLLLFSTFLAFAEEPVEPVLISKGLTYGKIAGIEQGDYFYLLIEDAGGDTATFLVLEPSENLEKVMNDVETFRRREVTIAWREIARFIPEAGQTIRQKEAIGLQFGMNRE